MSLDDMSPDNLDPWTVIESNSSYLYDVDETGSILFRVEDPNERHIFGVTLTCAEAETLLLTLAESVVCSRATRRRYSLASRSWGQQ